MEWKKYWQEFLNANSNLAKNDLAFTHPAHVIKLFKENAKFEAEVPPMVFLYEMSLRMDFFFAENDDTVMKIDADYNQEPLIFLVLKGQLAISVPSSSNLSIKSSEIFYLNPEFPVKTICLLYTSPSPRDGLLSRMPSSA